MLLNNREFILVGKKTKNIIFPSFKLVDSLEYKFISRQYYMRYY
ncbi:MAG: hypothetical protein PHN69_01600 [Candidatus Pacebacteria bacterium]|nr:hypothetical protein [Candidatus Paceibacterota bacterium]